MVPLVPVDPLGLLEWEQLDLQGQVVLADQQGLRGLALQVRLVLVGHQVHRGQVLRDRQGRQDHQDLAELNIPGKAHGPVE